MASNQREIERKEKQLKKDKKQKAVIWIIIAVVVLVLAIMKVCEININSIKDRFTDENGAFTLTDGVTENNFPYTLDASQNVNIVNLNNKLGVLTPNSFTVIDSSDANTDYMFEHGYSNPILASAGIYSLIYDQGAKHYRLDTVSQAVYEMDSESSILCADVNKNGVVALATTSKEKSCDIKVYNKALKELFSYSISGGFIVDIALNDNAKKVAVAVVNSENAQLSTTVYSYSIAGNGSDEKVVKLPNTNIADIKYAGNNIWAVGDDFLGVIKGEKLVTSFEQGSINTVAFSFNQSGELALVYGKYSNSTEYVIAYVKPSGKVKNEIAIDSNVKSVCATTGLVTVLTNDDIVTYNLRNGEEKSRIATNDSAKSICKIGSGIYIQKQSIIIRGEEEE